MKNPNEQWVDYLNNPNIRPKTFNVTVERQRDGTFKVVGNGATMLKIVNQYKAEWVPVDARDIANALRNAPVVAN